MITETLQVQHVPSLRETPRPSIGGHRPTVDLRCTCRWVSQLSYDTAAEALAAHSDHVHAFNTIRVPGLTPGDRLRFGDRSAVWLVRATAASGRYAIATTPHFGTVRNTVIDRLEQVRGPMNVIGYGPDITTRSGPDTGVDDMVRRLEGRPEPDDQTTDLDGWHPAMPPFEVSYLRRVPLRIARHDRTGTENRRAA